MSNRPPLYSAADSCILRGMTLKKTLEPSSSSFSFESVDRNRIFLFIAHGSREEKSNQSFFDLLSQFRQVFPREKVEGCFLEIAKPSIPEAIEAAIRKGAREIFLIPLMLFRGRHAEQDIPAMIQEARAKHPDIDFHYASPLSEDPFFLETLNRKVQSFVKPQTGKRS
ncbi:MAG: hypothetical protein EXS63_05055 [Candidatus Omnitrophica bacterium]|nr:hypothetical protein [Candidatus Omnitrophota bacterium]